MGVGWANCYAPEMGCGASVPAGELENELKIEKTKNEEAQRQLDHMKELYQLFPKGPGKLAARVSGLPKPQGCI